MAVMKEYRKRMISVSLISAFILIFFSGCGSAEKTGSLDSVDPAKYLTLGEYKGLTVEGRDTTVSDGDVERSIQSILEENGGLEEVTGRPAKMGDTVNIDYIGEKDGVAFDGGTGNKDLKLGSGEFIPGFEEGVVGMVAGDEKDLNLTFPENYHNQELAGADVVFHVTVNRISEDSIPELNDDFVKSLDNGTQTVDEYREYIRNELTEQNESEAKANLEAELLQQAVDNTTCDPEKLPEWLVSQNSAEFRESTESFVRQYGMTLDDYLAQTGSDMETFNEEAEEYGKEKAKSDLIVLSIAKAEGLDVTDSDLEEFYREYASDYNTTVERMKQAIPENEIRTYLLQQKVMDFLYDNANITFSEK